MFLLGICTFVGVVAMAMIISGSIMMFINLPSLLIVIPPAVLITLASSSKQSRCHAVKLLLSEDINLGKVELIAAKQVFTTFGNMNMLMGWVGVVIGAIAMANTINGENISQVFGPAFSVCVLTLFYALLIKALCYAAEAKIQFKIITLAP
ncbi:MAG: hypothetical protein JKY14_08690 [Paraglaciecola sp.]|nr:hypothetical protein [Paraglaciecola sp.]